MLVSVWSVKGGVGTSVVAALAAINSSNNKQAGIPDAGETVLVDTCGDLAAVLGCREPSGPGLAEWLAQRGDGPPDALARLCVPVAPRLSLIGPGNRQLPQVEPDETQLAQLDAFPGTVLVDAGCLWGDRPAASAFCLRADRSVLVTRACYLALRRAQDAPFAPTGVVLVTEAGRALRRDDVEAATGARVIAEIAVDPRIARAVDAGLLLARAPRGLGDALAGVA